MYPHHPSYSYTYHAPSYITYHPPPPADHVTPPHSAPPFARAYPIPAQIHPPHQGGFLAPPAYFSQPLNQIQYYRPEATYEGPPEESIASPGRHEASVPPDSPIAEEEDDEYVPGPTTSRARHAAAARKKSVGRKKGGNRRPTKAQAASSGWPVPVRPPVLGAVQPNIPASFSSGDPDEVPLYIQKRLKNFSGTLLAYPPGASLDINNLLIVTPAPGDDGEDNFESYTCRVCSKTYAGRNARSVARRHLQDKHNVPLSAQPRRSRWEREPNRPKNEEEQRARCLDQKRAWAKSNRQRLKETREALSGPLFHSPHSGSPLFLHQQHPGFQGWGVTDEAIPGSDIDAEGEADDNMQTTPGVAEAEGARVDDEDEDGEEARNALAAPTEIRLDSPVRLDRPCPETPVSSPEHPPNPSQWLHSISTTAWSAQVLPSSAPATSLLFGVATLHHGILNAPFVLQPTNDEGTEAYIETLSSTSPAPTPTQSGEEDAVEEKRLISVADSLLNMHSTPITSPAKSVRKPINRGVGIKLHFSPTQARSRSNSAGWSMTLDSTPVVLSATPAHLASAPIAPESVGNTPNLNSFASHLAARPRPARTRSLIHPPGARHALGRSISFSSKLDDPFADSPPRLPLASSPTKPPPPTSPTDTSASFGRRETRFSVSFDLGSSPTEASSPHSSGSPPPPTRSSTLLNSTPAHPSASMSSANPYDSSSSILFASSAMKAPLSTFKTPLTRRVSSTHPPSALQRSTTRGGWMMSSPANADTANELGLVPDHWMPQTPGYLDWVRKTPGSGMRRKSVVLGGRRGSLEDRETSG